jgi:hypothetical protein
MVLVYTEIGKKERLRVTPWAIREEKEFSHEPTRTDTKFLLENLNSFV